VIYADFDLSFNLSSFCEAMSENNVSCSINADEDAAHYQTSIYIEWSENETYIFSNNTYKISATRGWIRDDPETDSAPKWMTIYLDYLYSKYKYPTEEEARNATYLLEPSFELIKYFLNESSNPMPFDVRYEVSWKLIE